MRAWHAPGSVKTRITLGDVAARLDALEERVARLEARRAAPGDGRAARAKRAPNVKRCPGCGLPLRRRQGRCAACGRPLD
jgi:ribosomal protein L34E